MRKLARVGRPARWSSSSGADVGEPQRAGAALPRVDRDPGQLALDLTDLPLVGAVHLRQRGAPRPQRVQPLGERPGAGRAGRWRRTSRSTYSASRPASSTRLLPTSSSGSAVPSQAWRVVGHRDAEQDPVEPEAPGVLEVADTERLRGGRRRTPTGCRTRAPSRPCVSRSSSTKPKRRRHRLGLARGRARRWRWRGCRPTSSSCGRDAQQRVGAGQRAVGELDPQPVRGVAALDDVTEAERRRDQRRVVLDVGAHHEDVARLEGVRVVLEQPEQHLAQHLDLAGRAVAAVHLHRPVGRVERCAALAVAGRRRAGRAGASRAACRAARSRRDLGGRRPAGRPPQAAPQLALVAAERGEQRVPDPAVADVVLARHRAVEVGQRAATGQRWGAAATGAGRGGGRARGAARPRWPASGCGRTARAVAAGQPVPPRSRSSVRGVALVGRVAGDRLRERAPQRRAARPGRRRAASPSPSVASAGRPVDEQLRPLGGVRREEAGEPARHRVAAVAPELAPRRRCRGARGAAPGWRPRLVEAARRAPTAAARPARRGPTGRRRGCRSARRPASAGTGTRRPAHTPSPRRAAECRAGARAAGSATAPRPRAGTSTTSVANGSSSGVDSSSPRASASRSVRGARWRWSTTARPYASRADAAAAPSVAEEVLAVVVGLRGRLDRGDRLGVAVEPSVAPHQQPDREGGGAELRDARRLAARQPPAVRDRPPARARPGRRTTAPRPRR